MTEFSAHAQSSSSSGLPADHATAETQWHIVSSGAWSQSYLIARLLSCSQSSCVEYSKVFSSMTCRKANKNNKSNSTKRNMCLAMFGLNNVDLIWFNLIIHHKPMPRLGQSKQPNWLDHASQQVSRIHHLHPNSQVKLERPRNFGRKVSQLLAGQKNICLTFYPFLMQIRVRSWWLLANQPTISTWLHLRTEKN